LSRLERAGALLVVLGGVATVVDVLHADGMELLPLMLGLALLLLSAVRQQPLGLGFLLLLFLCLRMYLHGSGRYFSNELTLTDYSLVLIAFTASLGRHLQFWKFYLRLFAILIPLAGILSLGLDQSRLPGSSFTAGGLSSGQTVVLFGACLTVSLGFLWNSLVQARGKGAHGLGLWLTTSLVNGILLQATLPWAGLCLPLMAVAAIVLLIARKTLLLLASASGTILLALVSIYRHNPAALLYRLDRWRCFFTAMFSNGYRFLYGLGFTNTSSWLCDPGDLEAGPTFAHNLYAQIAADNGFFVLAAVVVISILLLQRSCHLSYIQDSQLVLPILALAFYSFLVLQIDAGWAQNGFLQVLIGFAIGSLALKTSPETEYSHSDSGRIDVDLQRTAP
jgi:hypothetical protein